MLFTLANQASPLPLLLSHGSIRDDERERKKIKNGEGKKKVRKTYILENTQEQTVTKIDWWFVSFCTRTLSFHSYAGKSSIRR